MTVPEVVYKLVERFDSYLDDYKNGRFSEAQLRVDFIDPLFGKALGWDIYNEKGRPEAYRDVVYEARVKVGGVERDVLMQAFQRRVVTYTPSNSAGFQVEMGNVGRHYTAWRYGT